MMLLSLLQSCLHSKELFLLSRPFHDIAVTILFVTLMFDYDIAGVFTTFIFLEISLTIVKLK